MNDIPAPDTLDLTVISERTIDPATAARLTAQFLPTTLTAADKPVIYAMAGIPGSGKSMYVDQALKNGLFPTNAFILDPDRLMLAMPEYIDDMALMGAVTAFRHWEIPARLLAYELAEKAAQKSLHIIQDMGSVRRENYDRLAQFKNRGYQIHMTYVYCPVEEALHRLKTRSNRHTAADMVRERSSSLQMLLPAYLDLCDEFQVLDNSDLNHPFRPTLLNQIKPE